MSRQTQNRCARATSRRRSLRCRSWPISCVRHPSRATFSGRFRARLRRRRRLISFSSFAQNAGLRFYLTLLQDKYWNTDALVMTFVFGFIEWITPCRTGCNCLLDSTSNTFFDCFVFDSTITNLTTLVFRRSKIVSKRCCCKKRTFLHWSMSWNSQRIPV